MSEISEVVIVVTAAATALAISLMSEAVRLTVTAFTADRISLIVEASSGTPAPTNDRRSLARSDTWLLVATSFGTRLWKSDCRSDTCDRMSETKDWITSARELVCWAAERMSEISEANTACTREAISEISETVSAPAAPPEIALRRSLIVEAFNCTPVVVINESRSDERSETDDRMSERNDCATSRREEFSRTPDKMSDTSDANTACTRDAMSEISETVSTPAGPAEIALRRSERDEAFNWTPVTVTTESRSDIRSETDDRISDRNDCATSSRELTCVPTACAHTWEATSDMAETVSTMPAPSNDRRSEATSLKNESVATRFGTRDWKSENKSDSIEYVSEMRL